MNRLLHKANVIGLIHGIKIARKALTLSSLMFDDYILLCGKACVSEVSTLANLLRDFQAYTGQAINFEKSKIMLPSVIHGPVKKYILSTLNMSRMPDGFTYLGIPLFRGRRRINWFQPLVEKITLKIEGWNKHFISHSSWSTLVQIVPSTMTNYIMSC